MRQLYKIAGVFITCWLLTSCGDYPCGKGSSSIALIGFNEAESDTVIVKRFVKATGFTDLHDSILLTKSGNYFYLMHDTLRISYSDNSGYGIVTSYFDYKVFLPATGRIFSITEVTEDVKYGRNNGQKVYCINPLTSYKIDGQQVSSTNYADVIYLDK